MRRFLLSLVALVFALTFFAGPGASKALAGEGDVYGGVKAGIIMVDEDSVDIDDLTAVGLLVGFGLTPEISIEGEFNVTVSGGDFEIGPFDGEIDVWTLAVYAAYRAPIADMVYLKGKLGVIYEDFEMSVSGFPSESDTDTRFSGGVGAGLNINEQLSAEIEYTLLDDDAEYLSLGLNYIF